MGRFLQTDPVGYGDGLNWYAYVGNDPLNRSDPTGTEKAKDWPGPEMADAAKKPPFKPVVVKGGPENSREKTKSATDRVMSTKRGSEMAKAAEARGRSIVIVANDDGKNSFDPSSGKISVDPDSKIKIQTAQGPVLTTPEQIISHEIGHDVFGTLDNGKDRMNNVRQNENPVARELGLPERVRY